jgi:hypothetical protein
VLKHNFFRRDTTVCWWGTGSGNYPCFPDGSGGDFETVFW